MKHCVHWEERLALAAGGDLASASRPDLKRHLAECPGCRAFLAELHDSLTILQSAHREPLAACHYTAVRARVMEQVNREAAVAQRRWWVYGALAAAIAILAMVQFTRLPEVQKLPLAVTPPPAPPLMLSQVKVRSRAVHRRPRPVAQERVAREAGPAMVQLMTDDPNVVIYWLFETKGE